MIRNYIKLAWRNLIQNKGYSLINIGGLAIGMTVAMLIGLWVYDELAFNQYHENYDRIALVLQNQTFNGEVETSGTLVMPLGNELRNKYGSYFKYVVVASYPEEHILSTEAKVLSKAGSFMEAAAPDMLSLRMLKGTRRGLENINSILLSGSASKAVFGDADPIGEFISIDNKVDVQVTGVYEDIPYNSDFRGVHFIAPWDMLLSFKKMQGSLGGHTNWHNNWCEVYVQLADNVDINEASSAIKQAKYLNVVEGDKRFKAELFLYPMAKWHLYSRFDNGVNTGGQIEFVWLFCVIGAFVLLLACINFVNLSTARSEKRAKEVGIRKVTGSHRNQIIIQFLGESLLVASLAFVVSVLLTHLSLPWFNQIADKKMSVLWASPGFWMIGVGFTFFTGIIAGSYPAFYLSSFTPIRVLKGTFRAGGSASLPRKVLVVLQFTVSVTLIIGTIIIYQQIQLAKNRPLGYEKAGLIGIPMKTEEVHKNFNGFREDLLASGAVAEVALSENRITNTSTTNFGFQWRGKDPAMVDAFQTVAISHEFGNTVGWTIKEGRDFSRAFSTDSAGFILNEAAVKYMGLENPIGENVKAFGRDFTVIGVVEDLVTQSLYRPVGPMVFHIIPGDFNKSMRGITLKLNPGRSTADALAEIEANFRKHHPATPFEYSFIDDELAYKFAFEERIGKLAGFFAILAVLISCLGLLGLTSFIAEQRTREVGVRKVLGASVSDLWSMLSQDFVVLVMISCLIATPVAWYFLDSWLQYYDYRVEIEWWVFLLAATGALVITLLTVSYQALKAALMNPVKSIRTE